MAEQRKDNKGRLLHTGESQMPDGRYRYQYTDTFGDRRAVYSWRLQRHDRIVPGKKMEMSLREKEQQIQADLFDQIIPAGAGMKVIDLVEKYVSLKTNVRESTKASYRTVIALLKKDSFGKRRIDKVKLSDAKAWLVSLQSSGKGFSTVRTIRGVLRPAFRLALDDDLIRKNPFDFELMSVVYDDSIRREALSHEEERKFMKFVKEDAYFAKYYDAIYILFHTGLRISEFVGLTVRDIDFKTMSINVDHQLQRYKKVDHIEAPKTESGVRQVPMTQEVAECFRRILKQRKQPKVEPIVDGYSGFLYLDDNNRPLVAWHWEKRFQHICEKYNNIYRVQMPKVTPHVCRHTFCSRMAAKRMNPKTLQYIMGHSDISVTLNTYTHLGFEEAADEMRRVSGNQP